MMQDVCIFLCVLGKRHLCSYCIVPLIYRSVTLSEACKQVKSCSYFIPLRLAKIFILTPYSIQAEVIHRQPPGNILMHSKINTPRYDFFAFLSLRKDCKFTIYNIFTLQLSLQDLVIQAITDCAIHLGTLYIRHKHSWHILCLACRLL